MGIAALHHETISFISIPFEHSTLPPRLGSINMGYQEDRELIPGTEVVYRGTDGEADNSKELVLIPTPTNNPDDPLVCRLLSWCGDRRS